MGAVLNAINLEVIQLALQVPKEYVVTILVPERADQPSDKQMR